ncbi:hypothetical protein P3T43_004049 [Paraburkholderia sp. GAS41]|jgi:hypothetical protein|uniref:hypothetical protein n=1 Tax=Paraburkholderia sp. GAS41 TaxID=3035134 RepID=UPI003D246EA2
MTREQFENNLAMILQDIALGTTADLANRAVAYWNGQRVVYAYLRDDGSGAIADEFCLAENWSEWREWLDEWMVEPLFTVRPELQDEILRTPSSGTDS